MRVRWRGLELPSRVQRDEQVSTDTYGKFTAEPFERGFGTTVGNSLRRILLSSLEGAAVTQVKIKGADHEFSSLAGIVEADPSIILVNKDHVIATLTEDQTFDMTLTVGKGRGYVTALEHREGIDEQEAGLVTVDSIYSPVTRVRYATEDARVGQKTDYDRLILEIWTNGTIT